MNRRICGRVFVAVLALAGFALTADAVSASGGGGGTGSSITAVLSVDAGNSSFQGNDAYYGPVISVTYLIDSKSSMTRNGKACKLADLKAGDSAFVTYKKDNRLVYQMRVTGP